MPKTIRILTALICSLPLLYAEGMHAEEDQTAQSRAATATATTAAFNGTQSTTVGSAKASKQKRSKEEVLQEAQWRAQRAQRYEHSNDVSLVSSTCNYSRSTLTYSCE
jgi:hypothetical protein